MQAALLFDSNVEMELLKIQKLEMMQIQITQMGEVIHVLLNLAGPEILTIHQYAKTVEMGLLKAQNHEMMETLIVLMDVMVLE